MGTLEEPDVEELFIGKEFATKEEMKFAMNVHALKNNYQWKVGRSDKSTLYLVCNTSNECNWRVRGVLAPEKVWRISIYVGKHTCGLSSLVPGSRNAKPNVIGRLIKNNIIKCGKRLTAKTVQIKVNDLYGVGLNYQQAYRCKQKGALELGHSPEDSFDILPKYFYMLEKSNPDTRTHVEQDEYGRFKYAFMALGASLVGWRHCRPILCVDVTHLNTIYGGKLLVAIGVDAGDHLFPVAVAAVDGENIPAWTYFLEQLKAAIGGERPDLVFVSDRDSSIITCIPNVFPNAHHGYCYHHITMNMNEKFKNEQWNPATFKQAAYAYSEDVFNRKFREIKRQDTRVAEYLETIITFPKWSRANFPGTRYAIMSSNYAESFNNKIKDARGRNITNMFEYIRSIAQEWHFKRGEFAMSCTSELHPEVEPVVAKDAAKRRGFEVNGINRGVFEVKCCDEQGRVDLNLGKCFCGKFQALKLPCRHAAAALGSVGGNLYDLCSPYYCAQCYKLVWEVPVNHVPVEIDWVIHDELLNRRVFPPVSMPLGEEVVRGPRHGRTSTRRIPSLGEEPSSQRTQRRRNKKTIHCSRCKLPGHTKRKCRGPIPGIAQ